MVPPAFVPPMRRNTKPVFNNGGDMKRLAKLFSFSGSVKRAKVLQFIPAALLVWLAAAWVDEALLAPNLCRINANWICYLPGEVREGITLDRVVFILLLIPLFSLLVRRMHDHGRSGWWALLAAPLIAVLGVFLYMPELGISFALFAVAGIVFLPLFYWILRKAPKKTPRPD